MLKSISHNDTHGPRVEGPAPIAASCCSPCAYRGELLLLLLLLLLLARVYRGELLLALCLSRRAAACPVIIAASCCSPCDYRGELLLAHCGGTGFALTNCSNSYRISESDSESEGRLQC